MSLQTDLYDQMLADIITLTNRPDLPEETELALRTVTLDVHHTDFYNRDYVTQLVQIPNSSYQTGLDIQNLFPRFRALESVSLLDVNGNILNSPGYEIEVIEIGDIYDPIYKTLKNNVAYVAGTTLNIRSAATYGYLVGWFRSPITRRDQYDSWVAQLYPSVIIYWAAARVLETNGNAEKAARYHKMVGGVDGQGGMIGYLKSNYLLGKAR